MTDQTVLTTCPRDCYDACGILVTVRDGAITSVRGDPDHPVSRGKLCRKCSIGYNGVYLDSQARLTTPLRRVGAKGEGRFEPISWDAAMAEIASRWSAIIDEAGPEAILNAHYTGTCSVIAFAFGSRFFRRLGATEVDPDSVCNKAGHVALDYVYGSSVTGFDPRSARQAACIMVWGANPSASAPHAHDHWLPEAPGTVIVIDSDPHADGAAGRPAPAAVPRQRRRPGVRDAARDRAATDWPTGSCSSSTRSAGTSWSRSSTRARRSGPSRSPACRRS